jgi:hypothetical protein
MVSAMSRGFFWKPALIVGALVAFSSYSCADPIVFVTDSATPVNRATLFLGGQFSNAVAVSWTQAASFSNVTIDASLVSTDDGFRSGTAYLMSAIGFGTTPASEIVAPADFTAPFGNQFGSVPLTVLFSGLDLGPGTYYLVLSAPFQNQTGGSPLRWQIATNPVLTAAPSVTIGNTFLADSVFSTVDPFPPASSFGLDLQDRPMFDVSSVPEPNAAVFILISLGALMLYNRGIGDGIGQYRKTAPGSRVSKNSVFKTSSTLCRGVGSQNSVNPVSITISKSEPQNSCALTEF